jgi:hypothetical protein
MTFDNDLTWELGLIYAPAISALAVLYVAGTTESFFGGCLGAIAGLIAHWLSK